MNVPCDRVTVFVCVQCGMDDAHNCVKSDTQAKLLVTNIKKQLAAESARITVALTACMGACTCMESCTRSLAYAFCGEGRETLLFEQGCDSVTAGDIALAARRYAAKRKGTRLEKGEMPPAIQGMVFARVPPGK
jgi:predicted metal-binding protein